MFRLIHYTTVADEDVFAAWLTALRDRQAAARIAARLLRLGLGLFGDCKPLGGGVWELRVDWGPGYRVYYALDGAKVVLLLTGGDKRKQAADIARAREFWQDWQARKR